MRRLLLKNLCLSSGLIALLIGCSPLRGYKFARREEVGQRQVRPVIQMDKPLLYKASIKLYNERYSGLLLLKQTDSATAHATFITEIGMKMFDFEIRNNAIRPVYVFEPMNKPKLVLYLAEDIKQLLLLNLLGTEAEIYEKNNSRIYKIRQQRRHYYRTDSSGRVNRVVLKGRLVKKGIITYRYNSQQAPEHIVLKHKGLIPLRWTLNRISQTPQP